MDSADLTCPRTWNSPSLVSRVDVSEGICMLLKIQTILHVKIILEVVSVAQPVRTVVKCLLQLWRSSVNNTGDVIRVISGKEATRSIINREHALQTGCVGEETHGGVYIFTKTYGK